MKTTKKSELREWMDQQYAKRPGLKQRVDALMAEIEIEQELVALREARGISQSTLARMIGVSQPAIAKLESGKAKNVELKTLARYVAALGGRLKIEIVKNAPRPKVISLQKAAKA